MFISNKVAIKGLVILVVFAIIYNAVLALINSLALNINNGLVVLTEIAILIACLILVVSQSHIYNKDKYVIFLFFSVLFSSVLVLASSQVFAIDAVRNFLIICVFFLIGTRLNLEQIQRVFFIVAIIVAIVLLLEITSLKVYVDLFNPAIYYQNTRGLEIKEFNQTGVFGNAEGFEGRFTYGVFDGPRTSSIFLEQVGLANFCSILGIYLLVFQPTLNQNKRIFFVSLIILICLSNETRVGSFLALIFLLIGYFRKMVPYYINLAVPFFVMFVGFVVINFYGEAKGDDFLGRVNLGFSHFLELGFFDYLGLGVLKLNKLWDSGFGYLFASFTIFGAIAFLTFTLFILKQITTESRVCALGLSLYIFVNLMIGGNAIYSIKTAALLWLIVGFVYNSELKFLSQRGGGGFV